jgi:hypothetical protein
MKTTLIKLATMSVMTLVVTSTAALPAQAAPRHPVQSSPVPTASSPGPDAQPICKISGIIGWVAGMIGGNDVCGDSDDYDDMPRHRSDPYVLRGASS